MKSIVKLVAAASFCAAVATPAANAEPVTLADIVLDGVTAGACLAGPTARFCNDTPGYGLFPIGFLAILPIAPGEPGLPPLLIPSFGPVLPGGLPPSGQLFPFFGPLGGGGCGGIPLALCDRAYDPAPAAISPPT